MAVVRANPGNAAEGLGVGSAISSGSATGPDRSVTSITRHRCVLPCMGYGADGDHGRRYGRTLSPPRATSHPCRPITSPEPILEEPLHEPASTIRTWQDPASRRRSADLDHRRCGRLYSSQLHGLGPHAFAQYAGIV